MLDRKFVVDNLDLVKTNCRNRNAPADLDHFAALEERRKKLLGEVDEANRKANEMARSIGKAPPDQREALKEKGRRIREEAGQLQQQLDSVTAEGEAILRLVPNLSHPAAPIGVDDKANLEVARGKTPIPEFDFKPLDHVELAEKLDFIDFEGGARVAGHGFYFLKNEAVLLELALQRYALEVLMPEGFVPMSTPDLAFNKVLEGTGFIPRGPETQIYSIDGTDLSLVATAEITLGGLQSGQTFDEEDLPLKYCGLSHCFRTEAGAHGKASRGLYRVHQFTKVEMFAYTRPEESDAMLDHLRTLECRIWDGLGIPYRVVDTATGDLGGPAYRKFDLEAWMPGRGDFGEVTSTSNCTDYQARRLNIRYRSKGEKGTKLVHTLNGTAIAISRGIISVMENYQQADGSIVVPEVLRKYVGVEKIGPR
jgi:seryl-tRNA synthetase